MEDNGKFAWFVAGAAIGAAFALLYAPQSGEATRRMIQRKARKSCGTLADTSRDWMEKGRDLYEKGLRVADEAAEMIERGRKIVEG